MTPVLALVKISVIEFLKEKIVWICIFSAACLIGLSLILGSLSFQEQQRIVAHFGWLAIHLSGLAISIFVGSNWLQKEMDQQTCLLVLARPVSRGQFVLGKFLGLWFLLFVVQFLLAIAVWGLVGVQFAFTKNLQVFFGTFAEATLILAICFCSASFLRPALAMLLGVGVFLIGHWMQEIEFFGRKIKEPAYIITAEIVHWISPNLFQMNWRSVYFLENGVSTAQLIWVSFHSMAWILFCLFLATFVFRRKDLV
jgi:Cu-processing system permease protein